MFEKLKKVTAGRVKNGCRGRKTSHRTKGLRLKSIELTQNHITYKVKGQLISKRGWQPLLSLTRTHPLQGGTCHKNSPGEVYRHSPVHCSILETSYKLRLPRWLKGKDTHILIPLLGAINVPSFWEWRHIIRHKLRETNRNAEAINLSPAVKLNHEGRPSKQETLTGLEPKFCSHDCTKAPKEQRSSGLNLLKISNCFLLNVNVSPQDILLGHDPPQQPWLFWISPQRFLTPSAPRQNQNIVRKKKKTWCFRNVHTLTHAQKRRSPVAQNGWHARCCFS